MVSTYTKQIVQINLAVTHWIYPGLPGFLPIDSQLPTFFWLELTNWKLEKWKMIGKLDILLIIASQETASVGLTVIEHFLCHT